MKPLDPVATLLVYKDYLVQRHPLHKLEETRDPWAIVASVILSGNTTDAAENKVMDGFLARYPTPASIRGATRDEVIPLLPGIAHNGSKTDYLKNIAEVLVERGMPDTMEALTAVTGIGRKTAAIVLYRVHGKDLGFPLDTHCLRVLDRLGWYPEARKPKSLEKALLTDFPEGTRHASHLILTHHGRTVCQALKPACDGCKLRAFCTYGQSSAQGALP